MRGNILICRLGKHSTILWGRGRKEGKQEKEGYTTTIDVTVNGHTVGSEWTSYLSWKVKQAGSFPSTFEFLRCDWRRWHDSFLEPFSFLFFFFTLSVYVKITLRGKTSKIKSPTRPEPSWAGAELSWVRGFGVMWWGRVSTMFGNSYATPVLYTFRRLYCISRKKEAVLRIEVRSLRINLLRAVRGGEAGEGKETFWAHDEWIG
jgi:hypothetical protein